MSDCATRERRPQSCDECSTHATTSRTQGGRKGEGISAEVIDLRWIRPLDLETVAASVEKTGRLVVAEEQWHDAGWGASLISRLTMAGTSMSNAPRAVSLPDDVLIPYAPPLEDQVLPSAERIAEEVRASLMS